ncbi:MAG: hypothetical protein QF741_03725 [Candidatus Peribacteraceae bacterium]|jgi:hypothetical protein|nr:hypothetical protein [Candidatus Peribacteraceae bacterium]
MPVNTNNTPDDANNADNSLSDLTRRESLDFYDNALDNIAQLSRDARIRIAETLSTMPAWYSPTLKTSRLGMARATPDFILNRDIQRVLDDNTNGVREQLAEVLATEGVGFSSLYSMKRREGGRLSRYSNVDGNRVDWLIRNPYSPEGQMLMHLYGQLWAGNQDRLQDAFDRVDSFEEARKLQAMERLAKLFDVMNDEKYENLGNPMNIGPAIAGSKISDEADNLASLELELEGIVNASPYGTPTTLAEKKYENTIKANEARMEELNTQIAESRKKVTDFEGTRTELRGHMNELNRFTSDNEFRTTLFGAPVGVGINFAPNDESEFKRTDFRARTFFGRDVTVNTFMNPGGTTHTLGDWVTNSAYRGAVNRLIRQEKRSGIRELDPKGVLDEMVRIQIENGAIEEGQREQVITQFQGLATSRKEVPKDAQIGRETSVTPVAQQEKKERFGWVKKAAGSTLKTSGRFLSGMLGMREPNYGKT